jgi:hypothetical protein
MERKSSSYLCGVQCFQTHCNTSREVGSYFGKGLHFSSYLSLVMISFTVFLYCGWPWHWRLQFLLVSLWGGGACSNAVMRTLLLLVSSSFSCTTVSLVRQSFNQLDWYSSNTVDFYLRCAWLEFQPVHWLYWLGSLYFISLHPGKWHHDHFPFKVFQINHFPVLCWQYCEVVIEM